MPAPFFRRLLRPLGLVVAVIAVTIALANQPAVPFVVLLAVIVPACLLFVVVIQRVTSVPDVRYLCAPEEVSAQLEEYERLNAELSQELLESRILEETYQLQVKAFDAFLQGVTITDPTRPGNPIVYANDGFLRLTGYTREEAIGRSCKFLQGKDTSQDTVATIRKAIRESRACIVEIQNYRKDGAAFWNALSIAPIFEDGELTHFVGVQTDITAFKQMEFQLRQSQKMEAIGHLAGGVAHDFNNMLTVINGCCDLLKTTTDMPDDAMPLVEEIHKAGDRAATLTRQLLAFSRKTVLQPQVLPLNDLVSDFESLLGRLIGEDIQLTTKLDADQALVKVDPGQIEQVLMNLVVNARDAMPCGGELTIGTRGVFLDDDYIRNHSELRSGRYVLLTVTDTGCGMDPETLRRIFEPFFTTKPVGKGTGLGLAMVYGLVKASGGHVAVESELGRGTTFNLYFPIVDELERAPLPLSRCGQPGGSETVLLVEDEDGVRRLARQALESRGYRVLEATNGETALRLCREHSEGIDLLLSDVVMPGMSGGELRQHVMLLFPQTRVIFTSGYTDDAVVRHGVFQSESDFLQKPFTIPKLLRKVREVLDRAPVEGAGLLSSRA